MPDFHVVGHQHGEGRLCPLHNHLLRWHPSTGSAVSPVLHFHWTFTGRPVADAESGGPVVHADLPDPFDLQPRDDASCPSFIASGQTLVSKPLPAVLATLPLVTADRAGPPVGETGVRQWRNFGATFPPSSPAASRLQRWVC